LEAGLFWGKANIALELVLEGLGVLRQGKASIASKLVMGL